MLFLKFNYIYYNPLKNLFNKLNLELFIKILLGYKVKMNNHMFKILMTFLFIISFILELVKK